ncbi:hypothetical protein [Winogradskya humida]|uniref:Uncharacterized protein n=1 Tax=Winogradskya humida TaxID=113566 RepID=A0ABQ3ZN57_9ACTN|nr:hypothetical protein [Actinoplanes humidus]GIE19978.1 hypothetical protein Ahu01nite_030800 [Actinoplanes humidus]
MQPAAPAPTARPTVVTVSSYLLYVTAAGSLIGAILALSMVSRTSDVYNDLYASTPEGSAGATAAVAIEVVSVAINILVAAGLVILAIFNNRARRGSRITTWVIGGIFLCCNGFGLAATSVAGSLDLETDTTSGPTQQQVQDSLEAALPSWYSPVTMTLAVIGIVALLGAVILLMLPAANAYFRKPQMAWDPSVPYPTYPGQPGFGQPGYGQPGSVPPPPGYGPPGYSQPGYPQPGYPSPQSGQQPPPVSGGQPHTGSLPATDPWGQPPASPPPSSGPPSSPPPSPPGEHRPPTDPAP